MKTIRFSGKAIVVDFNQEDADGEALIITDPEVLKTLDGLKCDDEDSIFSEYLSDGGDDTLVKAGVSGGIMWFEFSAPQNILLGHTEYTLARELNAKEIKKLKEYTVGQWSDGIGSSFVQERMLIGLAPQLIFIDEAEVIYAQSS